MRKIIHIDMDAFYASVEQRDNPTYRGKPLIISGPPNSRSVVSTCSYEARKFGIHSAMPASHAFKLCPHGIFIPPNMQKYIEVSCQVREIFHKYTEMVEPLSLDEAYLDISGLYPSASHIARKILQEIYETTGLTASAGVSYNKFLAKCASDFKKPAGMTIIPPEKADKFLSELPIKRFYGIGKKTCKRMIELGITNGKELRERPLFELNEIFGKTGTYYYYAARGIDDRPVETDSIRKSVGRENTYSHDLLEKEEILHALEEICRCLEKEMKQENVKGKTLTLKIKYNDFRQITRSETLGIYIDSAENMMQGVLLLLQKTDWGIQPVRLLGVSLSQLSNLHDEENGAQLHFPYYRQKSFRKAN